MGSSWELALLTGTNEVDTLGPIQGLKTASAEQQVTPVALT